MLNFQRLIDWRFWFSLRPSSLGREAVWFLAIVFGLMLGFAILFKILISLKKKNPPLAKLFKKLHRLFLTLGLVGWILFFFSYEQIYLLGSHFWYLLWLIGFFIWLVFILRYWIKEMPKEREILEKKKRFEKYLPH